MTIIICDFYIDDDDNDYYDHGGGNNNDDDDDGDTITRIRSGRPKLNRLEKRCVRYRIIIYATVYCTVQCSRRPASYRGGIKRNVSYKSDLSTVRYTLYTFSPFFFRRRRETHCRRQSVFFFASPPYHYSHYCNWLYIYNARINTHTHIHVPHTRVCFTARVDYLIFFPGKIRLSIKIYTYNVIYVVVVVVVTAEASVT